MTCMGGWGGRESERRGSWEGGILALGGGQHKIMQTMWQVLLLLGKQRGKWELHDTTWVRATDFFTRGCNTLTGTQQLKAWYSFTFIAFVFVGFDHSDKPLLQPHIPSPCQPSVLQDFLPLTSVYFSLTLSFYISCFAPCNSQPFKKQEEKPRERKREPQIEK